MGDSPNIVIRAIWFFVVGWWLTGVLLTAAWLLNITVVGIPVGIKLLNWVPKALTLKDTSSDTGPGDTVEIGKSSGDSPNMLVRGAYFLLIGWWASLIVTVMAYLICLTVIGLPIGIKMFNYLPKVVSLKG
jgi:uncharacterized membrane protein YccF (DUF307 family)